GELLLFLNNDIEPFEPGWLTELVACLGGSGAGAVGATLLCREEEDGSPSGYGVQTEPVRLVAGMDRLTMEPVGRRREVFDEGLGEDFDSPFLIGACILIETTLFGQIGGFTHGYYYGGEDQDISLKVRAKGRKTLYSGRSLLIHHSGSTTQALLEEAGYSIPRANARHFRRVWSARLWRECHLDRLAGSGTWTAPGEETSPDHLLREEVMASGFCLRTDGLPTGPGGAVEDLEAELDRRGHRYVTLQGDSGGDPRGLFFDVAVHLRGAHRYLPQPGQLNVLWMVSHFDAVSAIECARYDLVAVGAREHAERLHGEGVTTPVATLSQEHPAVDLVDAVLARAEELDFPTRIAPEPTRAGG
ncbi:MAG: hypothetical protein ABW196_01225, partial [Solirubrobacterales bacterium]